MPYGTDSFTDRYGDYKQPTVIDYEKNLEVDKYADRPLPSVKESLKDHQQDMEDILKEILSINPLFAGDRYISFVYSNNGKLAWNITMIDKMRENSDWLFTLRKYLNKAKSKFISNNKS